jgi:hypothetical protein
MAKADRDDALDSLVRIPFGVCERIGTQCDQASRLFAAMLDDIVVDVALQSHQEVARSRRKCDVCHTQYVLSNGPLTVWFVANGTCAVADKVRLVLHYPGFVVRGFRTDGMTCGPCAFRAPMASSAHARWPKRCRDC